MSTPKRNSGRSTLKRRKALFVIGDYIAFDPVVVLVEIRDKIVGSGPTRGRPADRGSTVGTKSIRDPVLIVVVFDEIYQVVISFVIDDPTCR